MNFENIDTSCQNAVCSTCNGFGMIGGHSGQTPESYEEWAEACPDCAVFVEVNTPYGPVVGTRKAIEYVKSLIDDDIRQALEYDGYLFK